jgi:hypothetical protein
LLAFPWRRRRRTSRDDAGSMPLAMLVTLVSVSLSAGVSGMVIGQLKTSQRAADRVAAVSAAQAGLDFGLSKIRSAVNLNGTGNLTALPCDWSKPQYAPPPLPDLSTATYSVAVGYFLNDPADMVNDLAGIDLSDLNAAAGTSTSVAELLGKLNPQPTHPADAGLTGALTSAIGCVGDLLQQVPLYGLLQAKGTVGTSTRTLYATYKFHNVDETIPGGHLVIAGTGGVFCIGDFNTPPAATDPVSAVLCNDPQNDDQALFIYPKNLSLALATSRTSSRTGPYPYGLCISAVTPPVAGEPATFAKCSATSAVAQQWDFEVNQQTYYGGMADGAGKTVRSGYCLNVETPGALIPGSRIVLRNGSNCGTAGALGKAFVPDANVGAGGAGVNSGQYVNKAEVGRCLDLTNEDPSGNWAASKKVPLALISYPCKQSFTSDVYWNHKWTGPLTATLIAQGVTQANGQIYTSQPTSPVKKWCLDSPGPVGGYVWVATCDLAAGSQLWTVFGATMSISNSYQVSDGSNLCLEAAGSRGPQYLFGGTVSYVITATCDGRASQKWNSPTEELAGPLKAIQER